MLYGPESKGPVGRWNARDALARGAERMGPLFRDAYDEIGDVMQREPEGRSYLKEGESSRHICLPVSDSA
jgi:hypothetical protein